MEEERMAVFRESERVKAEQNALYIEKVRRRLYLKKDFPTNLTYAMKCGEVEVGRQKQIEFKKFLANHEKELDVEYAKKIKQGALDEVREKEEAKQKRREAEKKAKKICYQQ